MITLRIDKHLLEVWETAYAHERGFCKWKLSVRHEGLDWWGKVAGSEHRYMTVDEALRQCFDTYFGLVRHEKAYLQDPDATCPHYWGVKEVTTNLDLTQYQVQLLCACGKTKMVTFIKTENTKESH